MDNHTPADIGVLGDLPEPSRANDGGGSGAGCAGSPVKDCDGRIAAIRNGLERQKKQKVAREQAFHIAKYCAKFT